MLPFFSKKFQNCASWRYLCQILIVIILAVIMWTFMQLLPSQRSNKKPSINNLSEDIRQSTQIKTLQQEETKPQNSQIFFWYELNSLSQNELQTNANYSSERSRDRSLKIGQKLQLSTNRSGQTLNVSKWRQNKLFQVDMKTQTNSRLWVDQQQRYSKVSVPSWNHEARNLPPSCGKCQTVIHLQLCFKPGN